MTSRSYSLHFLRDLSMKMHTERGQELRTMATNQKNSTHSKKAQTKRRKARKRRRMILFGVEILLLAVLGIALFAVLKVDNVERVQLKDSDVIINEQVKQNTESGSMKGYRNIALFGVDSRKGELGKGQRTDTIMIASINQDTGEVSLCSVYRDTYLNLGNDTYNKCNTAYAKGDYEQAINMLNMNLDLNITDFVTIGFDGLIGTIDALGGVEIDVSEEEVTHLNNYQKSMYTEEGSSKLNENYTPVTTSGRQTLNGLQATAYCRIRATRGDDFKRAERQRTVLAACFEKAKTADAATLLKIMDSVLPNVRTSLDVAEMTEVLQDLTKYSIIQSSGFPFESNRVTGKIGEKGSCVIPTTLEDNVTLLHHFLFNDDDYVPSAEVKACSQKIQSDTASYVGG